MERKNGATSSSSESPYMKSPRKFWRPRRSTSRRLPRGIQVQTQRWKAVVPSGVIGVSYSLLSRDVNKLTLRRWQLARSDWSAGTQEGSHAQGGGQAFSSVYFQIAKVQVVVSVCFWYFFYSGLITIVFLRFSSKNTLVWILSAWHTWCPYLQLFSKPTYLILKIHLILQKIRSKKLHIIIKIIHVDTLANIWNILLKVQCIRYVQKVLILRWYIFLISIT